MANGLVLLAQLAAELPSLVNQVYNNVLLIQDALIRASDRLEGIQINVNLTLSSSDFCSKPFMFSLAEVNVCSRMTSLDAFKWGENETTLCNYLVKNTIMPTVCLFQTHNDLKTDLLLILNCQVWHLFSELCVLLHSFNKFSESMHKDAI